MLSLKNLAAAVLGLLLAATTPVLAQSPPPPSAPAIDPAKQADLQKLLNLTGAANMGIQAADQMLQNFKGAMPTVSDKTWTEFRKEVSPEALVALILPVYDKHLSHAEIKDLIRFYESPAGKKLIAVMPAITFETMQIGQKWATEVALRANQKFNPQAAQKK